MDFVCIKLSRETFPRFQNAYIKSLELQTRYNDFNRKVSQEERTLLPPFVKLHLCKRKGEIEFPVAITDIKLNEAQCAKAETGHVMRYRNTGSYLKDQTDNNSTVNVLIAGNRASREIAKLGPTTFFVIVVADDDFTMEKLRDDFKDWVKLEITVAKKEDISSEINMFLERFALAPLKHICEVCYSMLEYGRKISSTEERLSSLSPAIKYKKMESKAGIARASSYKCEGEELSRMLTPPTVEKLPSVQRQVSGIAESSSCHISRQTRSRSQYEKQKISNGFILQDTQCTDIMANNSTENTGSGQINIVSNQKATVFREVRGRKGKRRSGATDQNGTTVVNHNAPNNNNDKEFYERLVEGILALYGMSIVPKQDRPDVPEQNCCVKEELRNELFTICPTIERIGFRYRTFYVYAATPKRPQDEAVRNKKIASVLQKYGINIFEIAPCVDNCTEFSHVGAKIEARSSATISLRTREISRVVKGGTLGCFVNMNEGKKQCGLIAKHVGKDCCEIYDIANGNNELLGDILPETNTQQYGSLDISAALMMKHIEDDQTKLMDTRGNRIRGILHEYNDSQPDAICRSGQSVHIYGAKSSPGIGEITMPVVDCGLSSALIQVEDQTGNNGEVESSFAREGDSGAIVCVVDTNNDVHALSMVMGRSNLNPRDKKSTARRTYLTVPLSKGIQQLENDTGKKFTLC